ncbi:hypothetical protein Cni_G12953 [Canna indica]|uniref:Uncharacterized protein n=1 Tax=Canna indica TaxID=4628 RepID=A0AAQ3KD45_9LILI|nr:hypothetical protein Cni_G12953 [Canna indica]
MRTARATAAKSLSLRAASIAGAGGVWGEGRGDLGEGQRRVERRWKLGWEWVGERGKRVYIGAEVGTNLAYVMADIQPWS